MKIWTKKILEWIWLLPIAIYSFEFLTTSVPPFQDSAYQLPYVKVFFENLLHSDYFHRTKIMGTYSLYMLVQSLINFVHMNSASLFYLSFMLAFLAVFLRFLKIQGFRIQYIAFIYPFLFSYYLFKGYTSFVFGSLWSCLVALLLIHSIEKNQKISFVTIMLLSYLAFLTHINHVIYIQVFLSIYFLCFLLAKKINWKVLSIILLNNIFIGIAYFEAMSSQLFSHSEYSFLKQLKSVVLQIPSIFTYFYGAREGKFLDGDLKLASILGIVVAAVFIKNRKVRFSSETFLVLSLAAFVFLFLCFPNNYSDFSVRFIFPILFVLAMLIIFKNRMSQAWLPLILYMICCLWPIYHWNNSKRYFHQIRKYESEITQIVSETGAPNFVLHAPQIAFFVSGRVAPFQHLHGWTIAKYNLPPMRINDSYHLEMIMEDIFSPIKIKEPQAADKLESWSKEKEFTLIWWGSAESFENFRNQQSFNVLETKEYFGDYLWIRGELLHFQK